MTEKEQATLDDLSWMLANTTGKRYTDEITNYSVRDMLNEIHLLLISSLGTRDALIKQLGGGRK